MPGGSVLLIEDSVEVREIISEILSKDGFEVRSVEDGLSAWKIVNSEHFDLVISDCGLPGMDGEELLRNMRKRSINTPVLLTTGVDLNQNNIEWENLTDFRLLHKPFEVDEIRKIILDLLKKK